MVKTPILPVKTLQGQIIELEAAVTTVLAEATPKHVHRLRTMTRRVESQLDLLQSIEGMPAPRSRLKALRRSLQKLRRAAGAVRDLDVQVDTVEGRTSKLEGKLAKDGRKLLEALQRERDHETDELLQIVERQQASLVSRTERLLIALEPASERELSSPEMKRLIERATEEQVRKFGAKEGEGATDDSSGEERLHSLRKAAKRARYMAETAPATPGSDLPEMAKAYEHLQDSGGTWHDGLTLLRSARHYLGRKSLLAEELAKESEQHLQRFEEDLQRSPIVKL